MDINSAFLHGDLNEEVYMLLPPGFHSPKSNQVCKLMRSLYGLKQASRQWNAKLTVALLHDGFKQSRLDPSLFTRGTEANFIALLVYVDDIIMASFLRIEAKASDEGLNICQRKYAIDILEEARFLGCKPASTPMTHGLKLSHNDDIHIDDVSSYRRLIGRLLYLTATRPNLTYVIQQISQFIDAPTDKHFSTAHRVLRYIKSSPGQGLFYPKNSDMQLKVFSDSDWAACSEMQKSITGYCIFLGHALISWRSKKQPTVSRSSYEAEYRALAATVCEVQWLTYLLQDLQVKVTKPTTVFCDNKSAVAIAENHVFHERTKHINIDCHIV
ncbi:PREDICTED: uncharacterized protein LOC109150899 [Ipomoea nil]|uniref:uncharacterized protein LOC109150899 n=1 Tax=Ipomoea nil TaxID=35883 RepID=UPI000900B00A|nr:PREDICTED: uncharacterized protein LOC109150899 [Ipomoea nil]